MFYISILHHLSAYSLLQDFHHGISPVNILYSNQDSSHYYFSLPFHLYPLLFNSFQCVLLCLLPPQMQCISILFTIILFFSLLSPSSLRQLHYCKHFLYVNVYWIMFVFVYTFIFRIYIQHLRDNISPPSFSTWLRMISVPSFYQKTT
jgi:hypothetical protein